MKSSKTNEPTRLDILIEKAEEQLFSEQKKVVKQKNKRAKNKPSKT